MHTDSSDREDRVHGPYESAVDRRIPDYPFRYDGKDRARATTKTKKIGRVAHRLYRELVRVYDRKGYSRRVHRITKRQLKRAGNAIADLITSIR
jgi:hypothetical protein